MNGGLMDTGGATTLADSDLATGGAKRGAPGDAGAAGGGSGGPGGAQAPAPARQRQQQQQGAASPPGPPPAGPTRRPAAAPGYEARDDARCEAEAKRRRGDPVVLARSDAGEDQDLMIMGQPPVMLHGQPAGEGDGDRLGQGPGNGAGDLAARAPTQGTAHEPTDELLQEAANQLSTLLDHVDLRWLLSIKKMMGMLRDLLERARAGKPLAISTETLQSSCFETHFGTVLRLLMATGWRPSMANMHEIEFDGHPARLHDGTSSVDAALGIVRWIEECVHARTRPESAAGFGASSSLLTLRVYVAKRRRSVVLTMPSSSSVQDLFDAVIDKDPSGLARKKFVLTMAAFQPAHLRRSADGARSLLAAGAQNGTVLVAQEPVRAGAHQSAKGLASAEAGRLMAQNEVIQLRVPGALVEDRFLMQQEDVAEQLRTHAARGMPISQDVVAQMRPTRQLHAPAILLRNYCGDRGQAVLEAIYASTHLCRMAPLLQIGDGLRMSFPAFSMPLLADSWAAHYDAALTAARETLESLGQVDSADRDEGIRMIQECSEGSCREAQLQCFVHGCAETPRPVLNNACKALISVGEDTVVTLNGTRVVMKSGDALVFRGTGSHPIHHGVAEVATGTLPSWAADFPFMHGARFVVDLGQFPRALA